MAIDKSVGDNMGTSRSFKPGGAHGRDDHLEVAAMSAVVDLPTACPAEAASSELLLSLMPSRTWSMVRRAMDVWLLKGSSSLQGVAVIVMAVNRSGDILGYDAIRGVE